MKGIEYTGLQQVDGPIIVAQRTPDSFYDEIVYVRDKNGEKKTGQKTTEGEPDTGTLRTRNREN